ncbi:TniQ family protein [Dactylosporangium sp. NBC_01737]|uniref:TniQ family protein n=1 Tax=Dactylosporangium sp. NBC_01737 TaxID=2975959 RepID=UPI002E1386B0|nr:TniQ family protein [Dactylosporangium sp. NBC_01737]
MTIPPPNAYVPPPAAWPIRVAPLPGEALDSWLETYAHRLEITVAELLIAAQLMPDPLITRTQQLAPNYIALVHDDEAGNLAHAAGLTPQQIHAMTLSIYDGSALKLHPYYRTIARANDLTTTDTTTLDHRHPFLTAQTWIDKALQRVENGHAPARPANLP